ncbi:MAG: hypothetical protein K2X03_11370 [Bryobacteraceae bacterium]|nr:hypothetical protein [Bryobacteraceae bacterium]
MLLLTAHAASALDPTRAPSQYAREHWGPERGFPRGPVYAIAQTSDGYLWIGTEAGLVRFDGLNFKLITADTPTTQVLGLLADNENNLWVRLPGPTLLRYRDGVFEDAVSKLGMPYSNITVMSRSNRGGLLVARLEPGVVVHDQGKFGLNLAASPVARSPVISVAQTRDGEIWMGTRDAGLFRTSGKTVSEVSKGLPDTKVNCMLADKDHNLLVGTDRGVVQWDGQNLRSAGIPDALNDFQALAMARDRDGNIWVGTNSGGLLRVTSKGVARLSAKTGGESVTAIYEDREGNLWAGSADSIERLSDGAFRTFGLTEGLPTDGSIPVFVDSTDRLWFAPSTGGLRWARGAEQGQIALDGLDRDVIYSIAGDKDGLWLGRQRGGLTHLKFGNGSFSARTYRRRDGLADDSVYSVAVGRGGAVWAGTLSGGATQFERGQFTTYRLDEGLASNTVASVLETKDGAVWFATPNGLSSRSAGRWRTYGVAEGLPSPNVNCLFEDSAGTLWAGTAAGLVFWDSAGFHVPAITPDLLREPILGIAEDHHGWFWMATAAHVVRVDRQRLLQGKLRAGDVWDFGIADGLRGTEGVKRHRSVLADGRGRVWFSLNRGISVVDPERLGSLSSPILPQIQTIAADGESVAWQGNAQIPGGHRKLTLTFTGLGLSTPERVRFRYMLEDFDSAWSEPSATREAIYTNIGPGAYKFRLLASGPDENWAGRESTVYITVEPLMWQTWWFRTAGALLLGMTFAAIYRFRLRQTTSHLKLRFEERLDERNRIAQELHDTLLQGFLSASMQLHVATDSIPEDSPAKAPMNRILGLMSRVIDEGRNAVRGLRAAPTEDLSEAFARIPLELNRSEPELTIVIEGQPRPFQPMLRDEVYRIGREALVNSFRHARASKIELELEYSPRSIRISVRDNGCGIDSGILQTGREGHWGLPGMRERAERIGGKLHVWSSAASGTEVVLTIPAHVAFTGQQSGASRWARLLLFGGRRKHRERTESNPRA